MADLGKITALLPMKGHSERVPDKNLKLFAGKPLYHAVMKTLLACDYIGQVAVNTDSDRIKADLQANFPEVIIIDRPTELQGDMVPMNDIIGYDMAQLEGDLFLQTHSTNPMLSANTLNEACQEFLNRPDDKDSMFSVTRWQTRLYWEDGTAVNHNPQELLRTQDLPPVFEENSNFFLFTRESFKASGGKRIGNSPMMFAMNKLEAVDIDEPEDFVLAEVLYQKRNPA